MRILGFTFGGVEFFSSRSFNPSGLKTAPLKLGSDETTYSSNPLPLFIKTLVTKNLQPIGRNVERHC
jgi:hypothetical protein